MRNVGAAAAPVVGPANNVFANCVASDAVRVPVVVTGDPLTSKMAGTDSATLVTPVFDTVTLPAPFVTLMPVPAVMVAAATDVPVLPTYSCPLVNCGKSAST